MNPFKQQIIDALKEEGIYKRGQSYDAVLNPPPDAEDDDEAEDSIDIRPLDEVLKGCPARGLRGRVRVCQA